MTNIYGGRGTGKTKKLVEYAKEHGSVIVCNNPDTMSCKIFKYGFVGIPCITYDEYLACCRYEQYYDLKTTYVIDDIEEFLHHLNKHTAAFTSNESEI